MRDLILFGLFIVLLLIAQFASAKTVEDIIERYLRARGGRDRLAAIKSIYMEGRKEVMGEQLSVKIIKEQDRLSRTQIETESTKSFVLITDKEAWTFFSSKSPEAHKITDQDLTGYKIEMDIAGPLVDYIGKGYKAVLLGKEIVDDNSCYKIKLITGAGKELLYWIDTGTYLVYQSSGASIGIDMNESILLHKNYKFVDGIQFAHAFEPKNTKGTSAELGGEIIIDKILVNLAIDPKMYQPE